MHEIWPKVEKIARKAHSFIEFEFIIAPNEIFYIFVFCFKTTTFLMNYFAGFLYLYPKYNPSKTAKAIVPGKDSANVGYLIIKAC